MTLASIPMDAAAFEDLPPEVDANADRVPDRCQFPGCQNPTRQPGARGRAPKFCPEHKGSTTPGTSKRSSKKGWAEAPDVENTLTTGALALGNALQKFAPGTAFQLDGIVITNKSPNLVHELVELGRTKPAIRRVLTYLAAPGEYGPLIFAAGSVALPILLNHGVIDVSKLAALFGGPEAGAPASQN